MAVSPGIALAGLEPTRAPDFEKQSGAIAENVAKAGPLFSVIEAWEWRSHKNQIPEASGRRLRSTRVWVSLFREQS